MLSRTIKKNGDTTGYIIKGANSCRDAYRYLITSVFQARPSRGHKPSKQWYNLVFFGSYIFNIVSMLNEMKRGSSVVSALASAARGPGFDPRRRRGNFGCPNTLSFLSFAGMT